MPSKPLTVLRATTAASHGLNSPICVCGAATTTDTSIPSCWQKSLSRPTKSSPGPSHWSAPRFGVFRLESSCNACTRHTAVCSEGRREAGSRSCARATRTRTRPPSRYGCYAVRLGYFSTSVPQLGYGGR
eukprot:6212108-Pleurochrysis_carterae.AAC.6